MAFDPRLQGLWEQGQQHIRQRQLPAAQAAFEQLLRIDTRHVPARLLLSSVLLAQGQLRAATDLLKAAVAFLSDDPDLICRLAQALLRLGETNATRACLHHPEIARTRSAPALLGLAHIYQGLGLHAPALGLMDRARDLGMDTADFRYFRALQLQFNGRMDEVEAELKACLERGPTFGRASLTLARLRRWDESDNHLDFIAARLAQVERGSEDHGAFEFARYKELEDLGRLDEAWSALERGNAVVRERTAGQLRAIDEPRLFDAVIARCTPQWLTQTRHRFDGPIPIFVVGLPRSGSTLLERVLGSHSQVMSAGELNDFPRQWRQVADCHGHALLDPTLLAAAERTDFAEVGRRYLEQTQWRAESRRFYVDKLPPNFMAAGFIRRALPQARIVHMRRAPMDVCFSNYRALFGDSYAYSYGLASLAAHYRQYERLMAHWRQAMPGVIHEVDYADLVSDTEGSARALLEYCGLDWEPGCLDTDRNAAPVATISSAQVREPIHRRGLEEWRRYERQLQPLREALGLAAN
jgi:tetratricopeptide (TPR) repeat protein